MGPGPLQIFKFINNNIAGFRYRAYGDPAVELPWSEVTAISNEVTQYVLKDLNPGDQFEIQVVALSFINIVRLPLQSATPPH
jgi:hypothetical protein